MRNKYTLIGDPVKLGMYRGEVIDIDFIKGEKICLVEFKEKQVTEMCSPILGDRRERIDHVDSYHERVSLGNP